MTDTSQVVWAAYHAVMDDGCAGHFLADISGGDARAALNAIELGCADNAAKR